MTTTQSPLRLASVFCPERKNRTRSELVRYPGSEPVGDEHTRQAFVHPATVLTKLILCSGYCFAVWHLRCWYVPHTKMSVVFWYYAMGQWKLIWYVRCTSRLRIRVFKLLLIMLSLTREYKRALVSVLLGIRYRDTSDTHILPVSPHLGYYWILGVKLPQE